MGLSKTINLTVKGYSTSLNAPIQLFQHDRIKLNFIINQYGIDVATNQRAIMPINPLSAYLFIDSTNEDDDAIESVNINDNQIEFLLTEKYTKNCGESKMQIVLIDDDGCRVTLPEFPFEIRKNIFGNFKIVDTVIADDESILITDDGLAIKVATKIKKEAD